jgi:4-hydroxy-tetrahydrodipicolinate reductase
MENKPISPEDLYVSYSRCGNVIGNHKITFSGTSDSIEISHQSHNRESYADGAIKCAQWLSDKHGFYNINDYIKEIIDEK